MSVYLERLRKLNDLLNLLNELNELLYTHAEYLESIDEIRTERKWWVKPTNNNREQQGAANNLVKEITCYEPETFFNFTRLNMENFNKLLSIVGPDLVKHSIRESINPQSRLLLTLRFLATGDSFKSMHYLYRMGESTVRSIVYETCEIIFRKLNEQYVPPLNKEEFENTSRSFQSRTKIPHVIGAIDGKHIAIFSPPKSGTQYYNYKKHFSIVLLGVCDNSYRFIYYNVGGFGSESDGGLFKKCSLYRALEQKQLDMPEPRITNGSDFELPFFLLGDAAFPLRPYLLTPYSGRNLTRSQEKYNLEL